MQYGYKIKVIKKSTRRQITKYAGLWFSNDLYPHRLELTVYPNGDVGINHASENSMSADVFNGDCVAVTLPTDILSEKEQRTLFKLIKPLAKKLSDALYQQYGNWVWDQALVGQIESIVRQGEYLGDNNESELAFDI